VSNLNLGHKCCTSNEFILFQNINNNAKNFTSPGNHLSPSTGAGKLRCKNGALRPHGKNIPEV